MKYGPPAEQPVGLRRKAGFDVDTAKNLIFSALLTCSVSSGSRQMPPPLILGRGMGLMEICPPTSIP